MELTQINLGAVVLVFVAFGVSILALLLSKMLRRPRRKSTATSHAERRIEDVKEFLERQKSTERSNRIASTTLAFGQYIIGGILATSFIQESLPSNIIGLLGVLVVISSIMNQRFRPDLRITMAREMSIRAKALIRWGEDELDSMRVYDAAPDSPGTRAQENDLSKELSRKLSELEDVERAQLQSQPQAARS